MTHRATPGGYTRGSMFVMAAIGLVVGTAATRAAATPLVVDFEGLTPRDPALADYWDPNPGFTAAGVDFSGGSYAGFVVSSSTTTNQAGYLYFGSEAEVSAQSNGGAGGGVSGSTNFAVAYNGGSFIDLPVGYRPGNVSVTNTATAYEAILEGLYQATAFPIPGHEDDWFRVTFTGWSATAGGGSQTGTPVSFYLADYRAGASLVVDSWMVVDLTPLGEARSIVVSFASTDNNLALEPEFQMNTPAYVAIDDLTLILVPEPAYLGWVASGLAIMGAVAQRRRLRVA